MSEPTVERLQIEVESNATPAASGIDALASTLDKLRNATKGGAGLTAFSKRLGVLNTALKSITTENANKLDKITNSLQRLSSLGSLKISSSIASQITNLGGAVRSLDGAGFGALDTLVTSLTPLSSLGKSNLNSFISQLTRLPQAVAALGATDFASFSAQINQLAAALAPLSSMGKNNLTSFITQLSKLPALMASLQSIDMGTLAAQVQALANAFAPLATQMQHISAGFAAFPARIQRLVTSTNRLSSANNKASKGYVNLAAKLAIAAASLKTLVRTIGSWVKKSNQYSEDLNLFMASMGEYADEAKRYAETVGEIMGIDPGGWMRNQGLFMTLATGFGVAGDRAEIMSRNLTQLGYDLSSFFNMSVTDSMAKLQSGLAGELEPLRRIGYDLSVTKLQQEADTLGIKKKVQAMTQAEKAELRYYAIMKQVTVAQGDMARTLESPANQLRILKEQVEMAGRSLGDIFIPALNAAFPYVIAFVKVIRIIADEIASLAGFTLPEVDYSGIETITGSGVEDTLSDAAEKAKELKNNLLGIDELNIISKEEDNGSGLGDIGGGGGLGFELPDNKNWLNGVVNKRVEEIIGKIQSAIDKMKEWFGLTEPIKSWADFMNTRLYDILTPVGAIAAGIAAWKLIGFLKKLELIPITLKQITGLALAVAGAFEYAMQYWNAWVNGVDLENFIGLLAGAAAVIGGLAISFGSVGAAIGAAVTGVGLFVLGVKDAITNGLNWLNAVLIPLGSTLSGAGIGALIGTPGGPIGAGIGALIGLVVGLLVDLGILIYENWDEICAWFADRWNDVVNFFTNTIPGWWNGTVVPFFAGIGEWFAELFGNIGQWFVDAWNGMIDFFESVPNKIGKVADSIGKGFSELPGKIGYALGYALGSVVKWAQDVWNTLKAEVPKIVESVGNWFKELPGKIYDAISGAVGKVLTWGSKVWSAFKEKTLAIVSAVTEWFSELPGKIYTAIFGAISKIATWASDMIAKAKEVIPKVIDSIVEFFKGIPEKLKQLGQDIWQGLIDGLVSDWNTVINDMKNFSDGFVKGFKDALGIHSPSTVFQQIGRFIIDGFLQGIETFKKIANTIKEWSASVVEWFTKGQDGKNIIDLFKDTAGSVIGGFKDEVGSTYSTVKNNVVTWASSVKDWFTSPSFGGVNSANFATFANNVITGFKDKINSTYQTIQSTMTTWAKGVKDWFESSSFGGANAPAFSTFADNVISGFKDKIGAAYTNVKSSITTWASSVKDWFSGIASSSAFGSFASDVIDGFKSKISNYYTTAKSAITTWATNVLSWFKENCSFDDFFGIAANLIDGFINGIVNNARSAWNAISNWASGVINSAMSKFDESSPSKVFYDIGKFTVFGFNDAVTKEGKSSEALVTSWADSLTKISPTMVMSVDASALKYYDSQSFAKSVSSSVSAASNMSVTADGFAEAMEEFYENHLSAMAEDVRRQADKQEKTTVQIGNRVITDAVTTQQRANGYRFVHSPA
ncbi:MAG: hypothetical protein LBQ15_11235 [Clostridium sp.]|jgi:phage-related protein|nr:hypothetical protein [Clostridium sp.]